MCGRWLCSLLFLCRGSRWCARAGRGSVAREGAMRLEDVSAVIRPRGQWEAVDLGFAMTRNLFPRLLAAWAVTVVPLWGVLLGLSYFVPLGWSLLAIWWLKPVYDRVPLFVLSRSLFGAKPSLGEVLRAWPGMIFKRLPWLLFFRVPWLLVIPHFAWSRALTLSVIDLEGQRGSAAKARMAVLMRVAGGRAGGLFALCSLYETVLVFALLTLVVGFSGDESGALGLMRGFSDAVFRGGEMEAWLRWSLVVGYLVSLSLVELFYVGGGFGAYLNCRTHLEGWDVEISFRRLARRLGKVAVFLALGAVSVAAELEKPSKSEAAGALEEVLKHRDFEIFKEQRPVSISEGPKNADVSWLAGFGQILYYAIIVAVVVWLVWLIYVNRHVFQKSGSRVKVTPSAPRTVLGMDVSPESLPADVVAAAMARWAAGDGRGALSLLYRGSLCWLVNDGGVPVREGDTEGDCLRHTRRLVQGPRGEYFVGLTGQWVLVAYAERAPVAAEMERLFAQWPYGADGGVR